MDSSLRQAAQQALEALEADNSKLWPSEKRTAAITALKAALAEPVQDVKGCDHCEHPLYAAIKCRVCGRVTSGGLDAKRPNLL